MFTHILLYGSGGYFFTQGWFQGNAMFDEITYFKNI